MFETSEYVYDTIAQYDSDEFNLTTLKYQKISISRTEQGLPDGLQAYTAIIEQLLREVQDYLKVNDAIGFFVFKRPDPSTLSPHLIGRPFAQSILRRNIDQTAKSQMIDAIRDWKARAVLEYGKDKKRYFGRKHIWLARRRSPTFISTFQNPITVPDGHGGVKKEYIDINESCLEDP